MNKDKLSGLKILVVDDEELIREILRLKLENDGIIVDEACDGNEAFSMILKTDYDFMISDVRMPNCTGIELLDKLSAHKGYKPKIIMLSAFSDLTQDLAIKKGALVLLSKPKGLDLLIETISANL